MPSLTNPPPLARDAPLAAVAAFGLAGTGHVAPDTPLPDADWDAFLEGIEEERLIGLLAAAVLAGAVPVTDSQLAQVATVQTADSVATLYLERALLEVTDRFGVHDIDVRVLKGPAVARLDYAQPELRVFGDIDVLVRGSDFDTAVELLLDLGARRALPELRPGFSRRFGKGATLALPSGIEIDLHRTLAAGPLGLQIELHSLFEGSSSFVLGDRKLMALGTEERFLHSCFGAALGRRVRLHNLRDVAQLALDDRLDLERALDLARVWDARGVVARAVNLTWSTLSIADSVALSAWAGAYRLQEREARVLDAYVGCKQSYAREALAAIRLIPTTRLRLAYARALMFPVPEHLDARGRGRLAHLRHGARHLSPSLRRAPDEDSRGNARG